MAAKTRRTIAEYMGAAQIALSNTINTPEIQAAVAQFGYPASKMAEGRAHYDAAVAAVNAQQLNIGSQRDATAKLQKAEGAAIDAYQALAQVARAIYARKDRARLVSLGLTGKMPRTTAGFLLSAYKLFDNAALKVELADYGYTAQKLQSERAKIVAFDEANQIQEAAKGSAQHSTQTQAAALKVLNEWVGQYLSIARIALRGEDQLLEKIGVRVRATKTPGQRAASRKAAATRAAKKQQG